MTVSAPNLPAPDLGARIQPGLEVVEHRLHEAASGSRDLMNQLTSHLALADGKHLRPVLTLVCTRLGDLARALNGAIITGVTAVELTHLASLYRDDVTDSASTHRSMSSAQHLWGNNRAILAGDMPFTRASVLIAALDPEVVSHHARTFKRLCTDQLNETFGPEERQDRTDLCIRVPADKTGSLAATATHFGAQLSGAGEEVTAIMSKFDERIGIAFQIADDVIDPASNGNTSGKTPGTDLREGVDILSVLLLKRRLAQGMIDEDGRRILETLDSDLSSDKALAELVATLHRREVLEEIRQMAKDRSIRAIKTLESLPKGEAKTALIAFTRLMVDRLA